MKYVKKFYSGWKSRPSDVEAVPPGLDLGRKDQPKDAEEQTCDDHSCYKSDADPKLASSVVLVFGAAFRTGLIAALF